MHTTNAITRKLTVTQTCNKHFSVTELYKVEFSDKTGVHVLVLYC